jgi:hypothetical protein
MRLTGKQVTDLRHGLLDFAKYAGLQHCETVFRTFQRTLHYPSFVTTTHALRLSLLSSWSKHTFEYFVTFAESSFMLGCYIKVYLTSIIGDETLKVGVYFRFRPTTSLSLLLEANQA